MNFRVYDLYYTPHNPKTEFPLWGISILGNFHFGKQCLVTAFLPEMLVNRRLVGGETAPKPLFGNIAYRSVSVKPLRVCCTRLSAVYHAQ